MHHSNLSSRSFGDLKQSEEWRSRGCLSGKGSWLDCKVGGMGAGCSGGSPKNRIHAKIHISHIFFACGYSLSASLYLIRDMEGMVSAPESS